MFNTAQSAIRSAGDVLMKHFGAIQQEHIDSKQAFDFVTFADREAERILIEQLHAVFPDHSFYAEESQRAPAGGYRWIIDPLDGTTNYVHGVPHFAISVALEREGEIILGLIYDPTRDEMFRAEIGRGAFLNDAPISVSSISDPAVSLLATGFPFKQKQNLDAYLASFQALFQQVSGIRRIGSAALDLAYVACGRFEGYWELGLSPWDVAAGSLLVQEAGGRISDFSGGAQAVWHGNVVASNGALHAMMLQVTRDILLPGLKS